MFIHLGNANVIQSESIISIIDRSIITSSTIMEDMMAHAKKQNKVLGPTEEAKSVVITADTIYYSTLSVPTLKKRASMISTITKLEDYADELE